jgi:hypothetical protein
VAVVLALDSSRSYSGQKPDGEASLGAKGVAAWHGGWLKESKQRQLSKASSSRGVHVARQRQGGKAT